MKRHYRPDLGKIAIGGAPALGKFPARVIRRQEISSAVRGDANVKRGVSALLDSDDLSERLTGLRNTHSQWQLVKLPARPA